MVFKSRFQFLARLFKNKQVFAGTLLILSLTQVGCMHRRMTIRSNPPGARVLLEGEEKGFTPYSMDFTYYGTREITLVKPGYETETVMQKIQTPWYQRMPLDFVSDNLWPFKTTDRHDFTVQLRPKRVVPTQELIDRANSMRSDIQTPAP